MAGAPIDFPFIDLTPGLQEIMFVVDVLEWLGIIPDPISLLLSLFAGRPREQATAQVIQRLEKSPNAAARLWGIELSRLLTEDDIVISSGGGAQQILGAIFAQFVSNLVSQGVSQARAGAIGVNALSRAAQAGAPLEQELTVPVPPGYFIIGPQTVLDTYNAGLADGTQLGKIGADLTKFAERYVYQHVPFWALAKIGFSQTNPTPPAPQPSPPPGSPGGPGLPGPQPPSPAPTPTPGPGGGGQPVLTIPPPPAPDPNGDELTDCCNLTATYLWWMAQAVVTWGLQNSGAGESPCCTLIAQQLVALTNQVSIAIGLLTSSAPPAGGTFDPSTIVAALASIAAAIPGPGPDLTGPLGDIAKAITAAGGATSSAPPTDVSGIVQQLTNLVREGDVKQPILDYLTQQGYMSGSDAQVLAGADWGDALVTIFRTYGWNAMRWALSLIGIQWNGRTFVLGPIPTEILNIVTGFVFKGLTFERNTIWELLTPLLNTFQSALTPTAAGPIGSIGVDENTVIADAATLALNLRVTGAAVGLVDPGLAVELNEITKVVTAIMAVEELTKGKLAALINNGISKVADMRAKAIFRQELPGAGALAGLAARGLIPADLLDGIIGFTGLPPQLQDATEQAAYGGISARQLIRLLPTGLFSQADIADELTFGGMRQASQHRYLLAAPYLATATYRNQLRTEIEISYVEGLIADGDIASQLDSIEQNTDRDSLILQKLNLQKQIAFAKRLESEYATLFKAGVIDDATYRSYLEGIGLQPDAVNSLAAVAEAASNATLHRKEISAAAALARATAAEERKAAVKNFVDGITDPLLLAAALVGTGLTPTQAAAWVDVAVLQKAGGLRWIYGLQLAAPQAALLRQRATALADQRKRLQITAKQYVDGLTAMGIPASYINALHAAADAMITPKTSAVVVPVQTG
jgi:hypothetical protein